MSEKEWSLRTPNGQSGIDLKAGRTGKVDSTHRPGPIRGPTTAIQNNFSEPALGTPVGDQEEHLESTAQRQLRVDQLDVVEELTVGQACTNPEPA